MHLVLRDHRHQNISSILVRKEIRSDRSHGAPHSTETFEQAPGAVVGKGSRCVDARTFAVSVPGDTGQSHFGGLVLWPPYFGSVGFGGGSAPP